MNQINNMGINYIELCVIIIIIVSLCYVWWKLLFKQPNKTKRMKRLCILFGVFSILMLLIAVALSIFGNISFIESLSEVMLPLGAGSVLFLIAYPAPVNNNKTKGDNVENSNN